MVAAMSQGSRFPLLGSILIWAAVWLAAFGFYGLVLVPAGFGHFGWTAPAGAYWSLLSALVYVFQREALWEHQLLRSPSPLRRTMLVLVLTIVASLALDHYRPLQPELLASFKAKEIGFILMNGAYFLGKLPELAFQQLMIFALLQRLEAERPDSGTLELVLRFCGVFGLIHLSILRLKGLAGIPYILAAASIGGVFVPLIRRVPGGLWDSFSAHLGGYLLVATALRSLL